MPHQHHFLSRLDRISLPHVELALSLYRDPALVRYVLHEVRLPEQAARVALSLADPVRGPFLVVTREGVFVTCLGEGMSVGDLPVVPRGQLDGLLARVGDFRARAEVLVGMAGKLGGVAGVFRRLYEAGDEVSREEMIAASALQPLYVFELFKLLVGAIIDLDEAREVLLPILRRAKKLTGDPDGLLRGYWKTAWNVGHLTLLTGMSGPRLLEELPEPVSKELMAGSISWGAVRQGVVGTALRGAWAAARIGKVFLPLYKRKLVEGVSQLGCLDAVLPLGAMAFRHRGLRAEIDKALASAVPVLEAATPLKFPHIVVKLATNVFNIAHTAPEEVEGLLVKAGAEVVMAATRRLPRGSAFAFEREEDVPRQLGLALLATGINSLIADTKALVPVLLMLPWVARAAAEDLYLPGDFLRATRIPWEPEHTYMLLRPLAELYRQRKVRPEGPARKGPCPCGSGKKYKRCCEAAEGRGASEGEGEEVE